MTIAGMLAGLADNLNTIDGLRTFDHQPEQVNPPAALCSVVAVEYDDDFDSSYSVDIGIIVLVSRADARTGQERIYEYIEPAGDLSIPAAVDTDTTLGGSCADCKVISAGAPSVFTIGGQDYLGVEFTCRAMS